MRPALRKDPRYENPRLRNLCKRRPCFLSIPGCVGETPEQPSVPAHSNWQEDGKGVGYKSHDCYTVPGCPPCHWQLDFGVMLTDEQKKEIFHRAERRWWKYMWQHGLIKVA